MEAIRIDDHTWRIEDGFVRCFLLEGSKEALLIDSGASDVNARIIAEALTPLPVKLLNTHGDGDHTAGNGKFTECMMHPRDYEVCDVAKKFPDCKCKPIYGGEMLNLGERMLEIIAIPGHTEGSVAVLDLTNLYLFPGDSVQDGFVFLQNDYRVPEKYVDSLKALENLSEAYEKVFPSHGSPCLDKESVSKVLRDWEKVLDGTCKGEKSDVYGFPATVYRGDFCGFYCK